MSKKKLAAICICIIAAVFINVFVFKFVNIGSAEEQINTLRVEMESDLEDIYHVYYSADGEFSEENVSAYSYKKSGVRADAEYLVSVSAPYIRLDFGTMPGNVKIYDICYAAPFQDIRLDMAMFDNPAKSNGIKSITRGDGCVSIATEGDDPYLVFELDGTIYKRACDRVNTISRIIDAVLCLIIDLMILIGIRYINRLAILPIEIYRDRALIANLSKNDFKTKFAGSFLGIVWAFIQPAVTIVVYWFVFEVGLKSGRVCDYPFILWFMAGLVPWFFFSEALSGGTNALTEYSYLVKKVVFKISILPVVKVISSIFVHLFFIAVIIVLCCCYGYYPDLYTLQIVYYVLCTFVLVLGLSYLTSAIVCFFKDLSQIINIILQVGMWMTPIMWDAAILSPKLQIIFKLNPMYYVVDGFRNALLDKIWFWDKLLWGIYFWIVVVLIFGFGVTIFKKLRIHFADVL